MTVRPYGKPEGRPWTVSVQVTVWDTFLVEAADPASAANAAESAARERYGESVAVNSRATEVD